MRPDTSFRTAFAVAIACAIFVTSRPAAAQATVAVGNTPVAVAVNPITDRIYVANEFSDTVTVVDGATNATQTVAVGRRPQHIAVNTRTNKVYVNTGGDSALYVIDGETLAVTPLALGSSGPVLVDESSNRVYVLRTGHTDELTIVEPNNTWYSIALHSYWPISHAVDAGAAKLYVANYETGDIRVVDLTSTSDHPPTHSIGVWSKPVALALDTARGRAYVVTEDARGPIGIIDTATRAASFPKVPGHAEGPRAIALDPGLGKAFAAFANEVAVIGPDGAVAFIPASTGVAVAVNPNTHQVYVPAADGSMAVIDGASNAVTRVGIPAGARAVAVNPATGRIYVVGPGLTVLQAGAAPPPPPPPPPPAAKLNVQGLWWASPAGSESGWGINFAQQGDIVFATWFTYDLDGSGMWLVMPSGQRTATNTWSGDIYRTTGPAFDAATFDPALVRSTRVGSATIDFTDASSGRLAASVNGVAVEKAITRQLFASPQPVCSAAGAQGTAPNYQDLWWHSPAGSESGWGLNLAHQGDMLFVTWFTYGADGRGMWLVGPSVARTATASYSGLLYRTTGPAFSAMPWDAAKVGKQEVGSITLSFSGISAGVMRTTIGGVTRSRSITREVFSSPATVCR